jgi:uncharacterized membrane protein YfcA
MASNFFPFLLLTLGFIVGCLGTLIGAGGGFILVPILFFLLPQTPPEQITCISLAVVFFNAASGSIAYARKKRIDYPAAILYSIVAVPGALLGVYFTHLVPRGQFHFIFGIFLTGISIFLVVSSYYGKFRTASAKPKGILRPHKDAQGKTYALPKAGVLGVTLSVFVGVVSSFLGIGGGVIHVPALIKLLRYPAHIATATSHFILGVTAFFALVVHFIRGDFSGVWFYILLLAPSAFVGAQAGARLSDRVSSDSIVRLLAIGLALVGLRLVFTA